jgi:putative FmdB family regulatory protein
MPIYDYQCPNCNLIERDIRLLIKDLDKEIICKKCGTQMQRKICATSIIFKGQRWSKDGYTGGNDCDH